MGKRLCVPGQKEGWDEGSRYGYSIDTAGRAAVVGWQALDRSLFSWSPLVFPGQRCNLISQHVLQSRSTTGGRQDDGFQEVILQQDFWILHFSNVRLGNSKPHHLPSNDDVLPPSFLRVSESFSRPDLALES